MSKLFSVLNLAKTTTAGNEEFNLQSTHNCKYKSQTLSHTHTHLSLTLTISVISHKYHPKNDITKNVINLLNNSLADQFV